MVSWPWPAAKLPPCLSLPSPVTPEERRLAPYFIQYCLGAAGWCFHWKLKHILSHLNIICLMPVLNLVHNDGMLLFFISSFFSNMKEVDKFHVYVGLPTLTPGVFTICLKSVQHIMSINSSFLTGYISLLGENLCSHWKQTLDEI